MINAVSYQFNKFVEFAEERVKAGKESAIARTGDFFRKIVVVGGSQQLRLDDDGILYVGIVPFLMDTSILDSII